MFIRPLFKIPGGKRYQYKKIISVFPKNYEKMTFVEMCGGAASVLLNKNPSKIEFYNDIDPDIVSIYRELTTNPDGFIKEVQNIEYTKDNFEWSRSATGPLAELVRRRFSRGGLCKAFSWSDRLRGKQPGDKNAFDTFKYTHLPLIAKRLQNVKIYCKSIFDLFPLLDAEDCLTYIDPPYLPSTRQNNLYKYEMTEKDHILLASLLNKAKGKVVLCGYQSQLYNKLYKGWNLFCHTMANHSSQTKIKQKRVECLWTNY